MQPILETLKQQGILSSLDVQLAAWITRLANPAPDSLWLATALVSHHTAAGHICVDLAQYATKTFPARTDNLDNTTPTIPCPPLANWCADLLKTGVVGTPDQPKPLILHQHKLYLARYWQYEQQLIQHLTKRLQSPNDIDENRLQAGLTRLFPPNAHAHGQRQAALTALQHHFCLISGGPGTGKTATVVKILALLLEQNPNTRIALTAPTGKAAARLQASINTAKNTLNCDPTIQQKIPTTTQTIHRLLGSLPHSPYFRHNAEYPLLYDVIIVDEASMIDLALMTKLAQAIPPTSRWILLGDKDQLASVEAGTVLGDICSVNLNAFPTHPLHKHIVLLEKNYRFNQDSGIYNIAQQIKQGESKLTLQTLQTQQYPDVTWHSLTHPNNNQQTLLNTIQQGFQPYLTHLQTPDISPHTLMQQFEQFRVLCALRRGPYGIETINRLIENRIKPTNNPTTTHRWYHGKPIMITNNDYTLKLFNGDIGFILWDSPKKRELIAHFPDFQGENTRQFYPNRLPEHETAFAMTIHKSQGSEFKQILILLPDQYTPILTRELIYTAITRAREHVQIWGNETTLQQAIDQKLQRESGLQTALWNT